MYYAAFDADAKAKDVVKVSAARVEPIQKWVDDPAAFRSKNLLALEAFRQPDAIDIKNSYGDLEFLRPDEKEAVGTLPRHVGQQRRSDTEVRKLIDELNKKGAVASFPDPKRRKELGLEKPDAIVRVYADSLEKADAKKPGKPRFKKDAKPVTELRFGLPEGNERGRRAHLGRRHDDRHGAAEPARPGAQGAAGLLRQVDAAVQPRLGRGERHQGRTDPRRADVRRHAKVGATGPWNIEQPATPQGPHRRRPGGPRASSATSTA